MMKLWTSNMQDMLAVGTSVGGGATAFTAGKVVQQVEPVTLLSSYPNLPIILQIVGAVVGVLGLLVGAVRLYQNHEDRKLKREILEFERSKQNANIR
jgi:hypothetical protein